MAPSKKLFRVIFGKHCLLNFKWALFALCTDPISFDSVDDFVDKYQAYQNYVKTGPSSLGK
jgi:hypothetical protein